LNDIFYVNSYYSIGAGEMDFIIFNNKDGKELVKYNFNFIGYNSENNEVVAIDKSKIPFKMKGFNLLDSSIIQKWENDFFITGVSLVYLNNSYIFDTNKVNLQTNFQIIYCISNNSGTLLWQFDTATIAPNLPVSKLIGVFEDVLVVALQERGLIAIDVNSGTLLWHKNAFAFYTQINYEKGILILMSVNFLSIDIKTGEIVDKYVNQEYFEKSKIESQRDNFVLIDNHIITTDWRKGVIGAFNTQTHRFDWIHEEPGVSFPGGSPIKYFEPYLFVQDNKNTLHIFEKE